MLQHRIRMIICYQERDIVSLSTSQRSNWDTIYDAVTLTFTGFRRSTTKFSALCIINRVNLWHNIRSISSACLILMLNRIELIEGSIRTRSFSFLEIVRGLRRTSFDPLEHTSSIKDKETPRWNRLTRLPPLVYCAVLQPDYALISSSVKRISILDYLRWEVFQSKSRCKSWPDGSKVGS